MQKKASKLPMELASMSSISDKLVEYYWEKKREDGKKKYPHSFAGNH